MIIIFKSAQMAISYSFTWFCFSYSFTEFCESLEVFIINLYPHKIIFQINVNGYHSYMTRLKIILIDSK